MEEEAVPERTVNVTPYDNEVTLLYKWVRAFGLPTELIVVRPRITPDDDAIVSGTDRLVFEAVPEMVYRLDLEGSTPSEVYEIITSLSKNVTIDGIPVPSSTGHSTSSDSQNSFRSATHVSIVQCSGELQSLRPAPRRSR